VDSLLRERSIEALALQMRFCRGLGAAISARVLDALREDLERGGPVEALFSDFDDDPVRGVLSLRILAALHLRVLEGAAPELARHYPTVGGRLDASRLSADLAAVLEREFEALRPPLRRHPQTNEVGRSAALLGGFLAVRQRTGLPLRLLEIGSSAGLNLHFDRFRYELGAFRWGDPEAEVAIAARWEGARPYGPAHAELEVASREGCDLTPIDTSDPQQALRLCAYVWADEPGRLARLRAAIALAAKTPAPVVRCGAADFLEQRLARSTPGRSTVVFHSIVWEYLPEPERARIRTVLESASRRARSGAPLAWLRLEQGSAGPEVALELWPGGEGTELLGRAHPHAAWVYWLAPAEPPYVPPF